MAIAGVSQSFPVPSLPGKLCQFCCHTLNRFMFILFIKCSYHLQLPLFTHPPHHHSKSIIIHYPPHPVLTPHIHLICSSYLLLLFIIVHHSKSMSHVNHYPPHPFLTPHIHLMCSSYLLRLFMIAVHHSKSMTHAYDKRVLRVKHLYPSLLLSQWFFP